MIRFLTPAALMGLAACNAGFMSPENLPGVGVDAPEPSVATPQDSVLTAKERVALAIEGQNCVLNAETIQAVMINATVSQEEIVNIVPQLEAEGRASVVDDGTIRLTSGSCTA